MRLPRFRFTLRNLMVLIAVAGLSFGGFLKYRRLCAFADACRTAVQEHKRQELIARVCAELADIRVANDETWGRQRPSEASFRFREAAIDRSEGRAWRRRREHFVTLIAKYDRATRYPWLPFTPDKIAPPEPH